MKKFLFIILTITIFGIDSFAQNTGYHFEKNLVVSFPNGDTRNVVYLQIPDVSIFGLIEISITGSYSYAPNMGIVTKRYNIGRNTSGYCNLNSEITAASGYVLGNFYIGEYDCANKRIPIYHLNTLGNSVIIKIEGLLSSTSSASSLREEITLSAIETVTPPTERHLQTLVQKDDKVGIGTNDPLHKLEIKNGDLYINNYSSDGGTIRSYGHVLNFKGRTDNSYSNRVYRFYPSTGSASSTNAALQLFQGNTDGSFVQNVNISSNGNSYFNGGKVGVGTNNPTFDLSVRGTIGCGELKVEDVTTWSDFVFAPGYKLRSLAEVENFIVQNQHLPDVPSETQVKKEGYDLTEMNAILLQKIEELTLYTIQQEKRIKDIEIENTKLNELQNELNKIKEFLKQIEP